MIYRHVIDSLEKYSFITKIKEGKDFYVYVYYKVGGVEKHKSISRRANIKQLQEFIAKIKEVADIEEEPEMRNELPIELV